MIVKVFSDILEARDALLSSTPNQLEWGALVKDAGSFKLSSSISEA